MKRVVIVQRRLTHYRVPLFELLRERLAAQGVHLELLVGRGTPAEEQKQDSGELAWAHAISTRYIAGGRLCWQSLRGHLAGIDLLVLTQENKLLQNHLRLLLPRAYKLAFWGHGANLQSSNPDGLKERFKRWTADRVDWWFAYTQMSADLVAASGFPRERITVLNNAIDTRTLARFSQTITEEETHALRNSLGIDTNSPVGMFVGSLYPDKRLGFLLEAAQAIRAVVPEFHLVIVGDGPDREAVEGWCARHPWVHWAGARLGREKALYISMAQVMLNPGLVGLGILDSFTCAVPMITTDCRIHSPEIAYLDNHRNGLITENSVAAYAKSAASLLRDPEGMQTLRTGCISSAAEYTLENMARRFALGIGAVLSN